MNFKFWPYQCVCNSLNMSKLYSYYSHYLKFCPCNFFACSYWTHVSSPFSNVTLWHLLDALIIDLLDLQSSLILCPHIYLSEHLSQSVFYNSLCVLPTKLWVSEQESVLSVTGHWHITQSIQSRNVWWNESGIKCRLIGLLSLRGVNWCNPDLRVHKVWNGGDGNS